MALRGLIGTIYDAASDAALWHDVIAKLVRETGARAGVFYDHHDATKRSRVLGADGFDPYYMSQYEHYYGALDPWHRCGRVRPVGSIDQTARMLPDAELRRTEFYQDHLRPQGLFYALGGPVERAPGHMAIFGIQCGQANGPFARKAEAVVTALMPHFRRAYGMQEVLAQARCEAADLEAAFELLAHPVFVVDRDARLLFANLAAEELLRRGDVLRRVSGRLRPAHRDDRGPLDRALAPVPQGTDGDGTLMLRRAPAATPVPVRVMPLRRRNRAEWSGRIALLVEMPPPRRSIAVLASAFDLSAAEARLWAGLLGGRTVAEIAAQAGVSVNTVRVQLAALFRKTGTNRQADLVRLGLDLTREERN
ncbi:MAG TPA: PAS domain-containing protein [Dongiaceae bacterium]|nr:PAS domain-containing protein [Dongiaceae bacterium]